MTHLRGGNDGTLDLSSGTRLLSRADRPARARLLEASVVTGLLDSLYRRHIGTTSTL
jgi:hypothetical protein